MRPTPPPFTAALAVAAGVWMLVDLTRVWTPSLITIFGQAAETPAELMGAYAVGCVLAAVVVVALTRRVCAPALAVALAVAVAARVGLQLSDGGQPQLVLASVGVAAALAWLSLAVVRYGDVAVVGTVAGLALSVTTHAALGTWGAVWRHDAWGWVLLVVQAAAVVGATVLVRRRDTVPAPGRRFAWLLMPGMFLAGIVLANAGRASAVAGTLGLVVIAAASVVAVALATRPPHPLVAWLAAVLLVASVASALLVTDRQDGIAHVTPTWVVVAYAVGMPSLATVWAAAAGRGTDARPLAVALGGLVWVVLVFAYYAGYDLGYRADAVVVALAAVVAVVGALGARPARGAEATSTGGPGVRMLVPLAGLAAVAALAAGLGPMLTVRPVATESSAAPPATRVAAYNLRMGYGMDGTFRPRDVADVLRSTDVALLSEVDRGWYLNGGQDHLAILERLLDRDAVFSPAADPVWGDAVLTDAPIGETIGTPLPSYGAVTGAQALSARVTLDDGPTWFVSTHLQPDDGDEGVTRQAGALADVVQARIDSGVPVVVGGDLNTQPGSEAYALLVGLGLVDALGDVGPTSPADAPTKRIDHLFVTPDLTVTDPAVGTSQASDHLPVFATVAPAR